MSPSKVEGVARRAGGVCRPATLPHAGFTHSSALTGTIAALRLPFGLPFGREHFVVPELRSPTRSLSPNLGEQLRVGGVCHPATLPPRRITHSSALTGISQLRGGFEFPF